MLTQLTADALLLPVRMVDVAQSRDPLTSLAQGVTIQLQSGIRNFQLGVRRNFSLLLSITEMHSHELLGHVEEYIPKNDGYPSKSIGVLGSKVGVGE